jgi:outer membrane receptor protein involved in Fe transport
MDRFDKDQALFGQVDFDITDNLELALGARFFEPRQDVIGFTGYSSTANGIWSSSGEARCDLLGNGQGDYQGKRNVKPCLNVDKHIKENESIFRVNLNYRASDDVMFYGVWSEGYRPGGINRNPNQSEYLSEFLTNYEIGWKTQLLNNRLQFNGAAFYDEWDDFQSTVAGQNNITQIGN